MSDSNPTQIPAEPAWIKDHDASPAGGGIVMEIGTEEQVAQLCEGEESFCPFCGKAFVMWPMYDLAKHVLDEHHETLTVQGKNGYKMQMIPGLTQPGAALIQALLISRISLRRRGWQLGFIREVQPGEGPRIAMPGAGNPSKGRIIH